MKNYMDIASGIARIINLTDTPTAQALQTASLCESIKIQVEDLTPKWTDWELSDNSNIKIENLTPNRGPVRIPVQIKSAINTQAIEHLEEIAKFGLATKEEYRAMETIHKIMSEGVHVFTRAELQDMKRKNGFIA